MRQKKASGGMDRISVSIPNRIFEKIKKIADDERRSISGEIVVLLELALQKVGK